MLIEGVMVINHEGNKGWKKMEDGQADRSGWVDIDKADIYPAKYVQLPTDITYNNSPYWDILKSGKVVGVKRTISTHYYNL